MAASRRYEHEVANILGRVVALLGGSAGRHQEMGGCDPDGDVKFICGVVSPEDLVAVPRSNWVIASGYSGGGVHVINTRDYSTTQVFPTTNPRARFDKKTDRKSTRLNSSHIQKSRMPSSA